MASLRDRLSKSFLERNTKVIGLLGVAFVLGGSAFALLLTGGVFARTYPVTAYFTDAAGIRAGDDVTVAGLEAGTVEGLTVQRGLVAVELAIERGIELPAETRAEISVQTLLGKRVVSLVAPEQTFVASSSSGDSLEAVGKIPVDRTTTPVDIVELNDISVRLLDQSDAPALNRLLEEVATITEGQADRVRTLITGLADVTEAIDERSAELKTLLDALRTLSTTLGDRSETIVSIIDNLNPVLDNLAKHQADLTRLLEVTDSASHETADLVIRNRAVLDSTLTALHTDLQVLDRHQVDLAAVVSYLEDSVLGYQSVGYSTTVPNRWANIFVQSLGPLGIDAILGTCGAVDQLIDSMLGTDCASFGGGGGGGGGSGSGGGRGGSQPGGGLPGPGLPGGGLPGGGLPGGGLPGPGLPGGGGPLPSLPPIPGSNQDGMTMSSTASGERSAFPDDVGDLIDSALFGWGAPS